MSLSDGQVSLLFNNWLASPNEDDLKRYYWEKRGKEEKPLPDDADLSGIGYSPEEIEAIKAELASGK